MSSKPSAASAVDAPGTNPSTTPATPPPAPQAPQNPTPAQAASQLRTDAAADVQAISQGIHDLHVKARAEYDALAPDAQSRIHTLLNDLETMYSVSLAGLHTLFGPDGAVSKLTASNK